MQRNVPNGIDGLKISFNVVQYHSKLSNYNKMIISDGINHGKLQSIIVGELKKAGLKHRLKKIILKSVKDNKTVFGAPLVKVPSCSIICCGSNISVPIVVNEMCAILRTNANIEGLFRKAGSQNRQKDIKRLLDSGGCVSEGHHPIDVASVLKLYLRTLPEPIIGAEVQDLLLRCRLTAGEDALKPILHTLLLLPVLHVHLLHYIMELLNFIASRNKENLMDTSNLAIVMAPSIMPLPVAATSQRLEHHVALVKLLIENSKHIGILTEELMAQLDDNSEVCLARRKKRRSGSLNRVFHGLRKMVSGNVNTPATVRENGKTPILSKSAKRKYDGYEGLSAKMRKGIQQAMPQRELSYTPMKMGFTEKKRLRLSFVDAKSTPNIISDYSSHKNSETSMSSEDFLTSTENLFSAHDTIDLSPETKQIDKDYVRISKQEYEEIKSRVSAIENRLSREFTEVTNVEPLQQVQNVYKQTLEEVAMLDCPTSDHLARRLSKELKIRPSEENKIIRSPSARKIGSIRRRSKENVTKLIRHKSWNASTLSQANHIDADRFYPYINTSKRRNRDNQTKVTSNKPKISIPNTWHVSDSENSLNNSDSSHKYSLRKRLSNACGYISKSTGYVKQRLSLNTTINNWEGGSEASINSTLNSTPQSPNHLNANRLGARNKFRTQKSPSQTQHKWKNAAAFFMDKTGEADTGVQTGRPSVNKLRRQNAGAVLAKAKLFESSSDKSETERNTDKILHTGFARKPRISGASNVNIKPTSKYVAPVKTKVYANNDKIVNTSTKTNKPMVDVPPALPSRTYRLIVKSHQNVDGLDSWGMVGQTTPSPKILSPQNSVRTPHNVAPVVKKSLVTPRTARTPAPISDMRKLNTPMKAIHVSPRRRSPRQKPHVKKSMY